MRARDRDDRMTRAEDCRHCQGTGLAKLVLSAARAVHLPAYRPSKLDITHTAVSGRTHDLSRGHLAHSQQDVHHASVLWTPSDPSTSLLWHRSRATLAELLLNVPLPVLQDAKVGEGHRICRRFWKMCHVTACSYYENLSLK